MSWIRYTHHVFLKHLKRDKSLQEQRKNCQKTMRKWHKINRFILNFDPEGQQLHGQCEDNTWVNKQVFWDCRLDLLQETLFTKCNLANACIQSYNCYTSEVPHKCLAQGHIGWCIAVGITPRPPTPKEGVLSIIATTTDVSYVCT